MRDGGARGGGAWATEDLEGTRISAAPRGPGAPGPDPLPHTHGLPEVAGMMALSPACWSRGWVLWLQHKEPEAVSPGRQTQGG